MIILINIIKTIYSFFYSYEPLLTFNPLFFFTYLLFILTSLVRYLNIFFGINFRYWQCMYYINPCSPRRWRKNKSILFWASSRFDSEKFCSPEGYTRMHITPLGIPSIESHQLHNSYYCKSSKYFSPEFSFKCLQLFHHPQIFLHHTCTQQLRLV